jgi:hypothetical protein
MQIERADARTRTGDPFITSDGPVSAPVRSGHVRPHSMRYRPAWSGLEVTGEDNPVDGWWTSVRLSVLLTPLRYRRLPRDGHVGPPVLIERTELW